MRFPKVALMAFLIPALLIGCAALGLATPKSFTEKLAAGYIAHTAVLQAATDAVNAGDISSADAEQVLKIGTESRLLLDGARLANSAGDVATAEGRLTVATSILTQLQAFLRERGRK